MSNALLDQHARVLFEFDGHGRITRINESDPETEAPLVFVARGKDENLVLFRQDVPAEVVAEVNQVVDGFEPWDGGQCDPQIFEPVRRILSGLKSELEESHGPAFRFSEVGAFRGGVETLAITEANSDLLVQNFPYTKSVLAERSPVVGVERDGALVAACYSARHSATAAEAGVATVESHRGQGLAVAVVSAWAAATQAAGMTPLYSTSWQNEASLAVARKLGLEAYADTFSLT